MMGRMKCQHGGRPAFTLIELVTVIVILGILSAVALPVYLDYRSDAKVAACKGSLGGLRAGIANYYAYSATDSGGGVVAYPALSDLTTLGVVMTDAIPDNPFDTDGTKNNVVSTTNARGQLEGTSGGWAYNPTTGQIWGNTSDSKDY